MRTNIAKLTLTILLISALFGTSNCFAQGGIDNNSETTGQIQTPLSILEKIKGFFGQTREVTSQAVQTGQDIQAKADESGWGTAVGKVWTAIKSFFADKSVQEMIWDTLKLFLRVIANIFTLIANVINKILAAVTN
jgi:hypothetical protein